MDIVSKTFIYLFLPLSVGVYYLIPNRLLKARNYFLSIVSLFLYSWASLTGFFYLIVLILFNWLLGSIIRQKKLSKYSNIILSIGIITNAMYLIAFKVLNSNIPNSLGFKHSVFIPIGISFYVFKSISYLSDVKKGRIKPQNNIAYLALYLSFFPQIIAGPIIRSEDFFTQLEKREHSLPNISEGVYRFSLGFAKKLFLCNLLIPIADSVFSLSSTASMITLWIGALAYTLLIYFDFSGYSDIAIGTGLMFGILTKENFDYPYKSKSISEFWRRWHISLGTWFRDYVYIPLGGSRCSSIRNIGNTLIVWLLTGLWHGLSPCFVVWGLWSFLFIMLERRTKLGPYLNKSKIGAHIYSLIVIVISWVFFRSTSLGNAIEFIAGMIGFRGILDSYTMAYVSEYGVTIILCFLFCFPVLNSLYKKMSLRNAGVIRCLVVLICLLLGASFLIAGSYNPFIYNNF